MIKATPVYYTKIFFQLENFSGSGALPLSALTSICMRNFVIHATMRKIYRDREKVFYFVEKTRKTTKLYCENNLEKGKLCFQFYINWICGQKKAEKLTTVRARKR